MTCPEWLVTGKIETLEMYVTRKICLPHSLPRIRGARADRKGMGLLSPQGADTSQFFLHGSSSQRQYKKMENAEQLGVWILIFV